MAGIRAAAFRSNVTVEVHPARLADGRDPVDGGLDIEATEAYLATSPKAPSPGRITDLTPKDWVAAN